ncbi:MAG TPA: hypothetical protein VKX46_09195 [Ktedonobacteraceae bacterium]|nr:hypothetical protein [Ktedonobacteraceae bacterium]
MPKTPTGPLVLVISSDVSAIRFFSAFLRVSGYTPYDCLYGPEIVTVARERQPSLILLALEAPGNNDLLLVQQLHQAMPQTCPILLVTEQSNDPQIQALDVTTIIPWPCEIGKVVEQIDALIGHLKQPVERKGFLYRADNPPSEVLEIRRRYFSNDL